MRKLWISTILVMLLPAAGMFAANYYVDGVNGNDTHLGTWDSPWRTFQKANVALQPGDTVYVRGGNYSVGDLIRLVPQGPYDRQAISPQRSGRVDAPIVYSNYQDEVVNLTGETNVTYAVDLINRSFIKIKGFNFTNFYRFMFIENGFQNEVSYCSFKQNNKRTDGAFSWQGSRIAVGAQYNHVHHCLFGIYGDFAGPDGNGDQGRGAVLEIGNENKIDDFTSYNLIEYNHVYHGGHHTIGMAGCYNVFRYNYMHNEAWWSRNPEDPQIGYRVSFLMGRPECNYRNLLEGNRIAFGGPRIDLENRAGGSGLPITTSHNIIRKNQFYGNSLSAMPITVYPNLNGAAVGNHIYNNTLYNNGVKRENDATDEDRHPIKFGITAEDYSVIHSNVIKNNLLWKNFESIKGQGIIRNGIRPVLNQIIENNWDEQGDPLFVYESENLDPFGPAPDFRLKPESPCIDKGIFLTIVTSPSGTGTTFRVADAGYFMDGWGVVEGDEIQLQGNPRRARITNINYESNLITVNAAIAWMRDQGVSLAYEGSAPDMGAHEYTHGLHLGSPLGGERWVRGTNRNIIWSSSGVTEPLRIELFKGGVLNHAIADNQPVAEGFYTWVIPADQTPGNDYSIKLTAGEHESTSGNFSIADPGAPMAQTLAAQSITTNSAVLRGTLHPMGLATSYRFEYGLTTTYGTTTPDATLAADADQATVQVAIAGLNASTTYHFRIVAINSAGTTQGGDLTFTTSSSGGGVSGGSGDAGGGGGGGCFIDPANQNAALWANLILMFLFFLVLDLIGRYRVKTSSNIRPDGAGKLDLSGYTNACQCTLSKQGGNQ